MIGSSSFRMAAGVTVLIGSVLLSPLPARSQNFRGEIESVVKEYLASHPEEIGLIARNYLAQHPEALQEAIVALLKRRGGTAAVDTNSDKSAAVQSNAEALLRSTHQVNLGNAKGEQVLVEFFDYNCGYCKRALSDMVELMRDNPGLRVVLKEMPILGAGSLEAARVAIAVRMQNPGNGKLFDFHRRLLGTRGQANKDTAMAAAAEAGLDMARIEQDLNSAEVKVTIDESMRLARSLGINGTPGYVIGDTVVAGAIGYAALNSRLHAAIRQ
jgi:protein-disulfide isomerase